MENKKFSGARLRSARMMRAMTLTDLSEKTQISKQSLSFYENDVNTPPSENLLRIAQVLDVPIDFFRDHAYVVRQADTVYFRSQVSANKKDRTAQIEKLTYVEQVYRILARYVDFCPCRLPEVSFESDAEEGDYVSKSILDRLDNAADRVREQWNLGRGPLEHLQYTLEENGIVVTGFTLNETKIDAFSQRIRNEEGQFVYLVALGLGSKSQERLNFDMAHELGHILLHPWGEDLETLSKAEFNGREKQANAFAGALLMPREEFAKDVALYPTDLTYYLHLKKKWRVSVQAMIYRARQIDLITANQYLYLIRRISQNGWRSREPYDCPGRLNDTIFQGAIDLLYAHGIFDAETLMEVFGANGVRLRAADLEDFMQLRKNTLKPKEPDRKKVLKLKE